MILQLNYPIYPHYHFHIIQLQIQILIFNGTSGIYNSTSKTIIIFTSKTSALTIDTNQCIYGNGTGLTHLQYTNIDNKPSNFQSDWNTTVINKPDLSVYATNTNVNNLSSQSYFLTNYTNLNSLSVSGTTKLNGVTTCMSALNVKGGVMCENINIVDSSTYSGQYQVSISLPTGITNSKNSNNTTRNGI